jgi:hypothetical protein
MYLSVSVFQSFLFNVNVVKGIGVMSANGWGAYLQSRKHPRNIYKSAEKFLNCFQFIYLIKPYVHGEFSYESNNKIMTNY